MKDSEDTKKELFSLEEIDYHNVNILRKCDILDALRCAKVVIIRDGDIDLFAGVLIYVNRAIKETISLLALESKDYKVTKNQKL